MGTVKKSFGVALFSAVVAVSATLAPAATIFTYDTGSGTHAASAAFDVNGSVLTVTLTSYGSAQASSADFLTGFLFNVSGVTLTAGNSGAFSSGTLVNVSTAEVVQTYSGSNTTDHYWGAAIPPTVGSGFGYALLAAGLNLNNGAKSFDNTNLGGADGAILPNTLSVGSTLSGASGSGLNNNEPYVLGSAAFKFTISGGTLVASDLGSGEFAFGTVPDVTTTVGGPPPPPVPVPAAVWSGLSLLGLLGVRALRKKAY
jgi:hypothetical protein